MHVQPAAFFRTTSPLALSQLSDMDSERFHSSWWPDHLSSTQTVYVAAIAF